MKSALRILGNVVVRVSHLFTRSFLQRLFGVVLIVPTLRSGPRLRQLANVGAFSLVVVILSFAFLVLPSYAAPNLQINYQGKLTDSSNVAVADGSYIMKFRLYTTASSATTTNIWEEIRTATGDKATVTSGLFSVMLGSSTPLTSVNFNQTLYLGVEVCGTTDLSGCDGEMTPRKIIGAVPASFEADKLDGLDSASFARLDTTSTFASGFLSTASSTITNLTMINSTTTSATTTNLYVSGLSTLSGGLLVSNATSTITNLTMINSTTTSATSTNLYVSGDMNLNTGLSYKIAGTSVLNATTLGTLVVNSSLTSVGTLTALTVSGLTTLDRFVVNSTTATSTFSTGGLTIGTSQFIVQQNSGYIGIGTTTPSDKLTLYDGSFRQAPGNPVQVGSVALGQQYSHIAVQGRYGYVVSYGDDVLKVIDLSNPTGPVNVGTPVSLGTVSNTVRLAVSGRYAYVVYSSTLKIVDLADPDALSIVSTLSSLPLGSYMDIAVSGRYLYVVDSGTSPGNDVNLTIVDVGDPFTPRVVSTTQVQAAPNGITSDTVSVAVSGRYVYVVDSRGDTLEIYDVSNPVSPLLLVEVALSGLATLRDLTISGRYLYFIDASNSRLQIFDVASSTNPISAANLTLDSGIDGFALAGRYGYVVSTADTIKTIDLASSTAPVVVGSTSISFASGAALAVSGRYGYVVDLNGTSGNLTVFDLSGLEAATGMIHALEAGTLQVRQDSAFDQNLSIRGGLNIGTGGLYVSGILGVGPSSISQGSATISAYFQGSVGIASTSPWGLLSVEMDTTNPAFVVANQGSTTPAFWIGGVNQNGHIGIGTTTLNTTFNVDGNWRGNSFVNAGAYTSTQTVTVPNKALIYHLTNNIGTAYAAGPSVITVTYNITGLTNTEGAFAYIYTFAQKGITDDVAPEASVVNIQINGTQVSTVTTPTQNGASQIFESYITAYSNGAWNLFGTPATTTADLAEWIEAEGEKPVAGELVSFGTEPVKVRRSSSAYDPNLAGIVSTNPHTVMGAETPTAVMLSLAGRVPVKVSGENGPIGIGDYLTSSSIPGVAMRASRAGRVVGRALESFTGEKGEVLTLVETADWSGPNLAEVLAGMASTTATLAERVTALENAPQQLVTSAPPIDSAILESLISSPSFTTRITGWFADIGNGIGDLFANTFRAQEKVCIGATCINEEMLKSLLNNNNINTQPEPPPPIVEEISPPAGETGTTTDETAPTTEEVIEPVMEVEEEVPTLSRDPDQGVGITTEDIPPVNQPEPPEAVDIPSPEPPVVLENVP